MQNLLNLTLQVTIDGESSDNEVNIITRQLVDEMQRLESIHSADMVTEKNVPKGAKAGELALVGSISIAVLPQLLPQLIEYLKAWSLRGSGSIKIIKPGIKAEFPAEISPEKLEQFIEIINKQDKS